MGREGWRRGGIHPQPFDLKTPREAFIWPTISPKPRDCFLVADHGTECAARDSAECHLARSCFQVLIEPSNRLCRHGDVLSRTTSLIRSFARGGMQRASSEFQRPIVRELGRARRRVRRVRSNLLPSPALRRRWAASLRLAHPQSACPCRWRRSLRAGCRWCRKTDSRPRS